jgi:hypothetical protein
LRDASPTEFQRLIAAEFDRQCWEYGLVGDNIVAEIERSGEVIRTSSSSVLWLSSSSAIARVLCGAAVSNRLVDLHAECVGDAL